MTKMNWTLSLVALALAIAALMLGRAACVGDLQDRSNASPAAELEGEIAKEAFESLPESRAERRRELLDELRAHPRHIGDYLLVPAELEVQALEATGMFKELTGRALAELRYDLADYERVGFDSNSDELAREIPKGSLLFIRHMAEDGTSCLTCVLYDEEGFIFYDYPRGFRTAKAPDHTGFSGGLSALLTVGSVVTGFIPPNAD